MKKQKLYILVTFITVNAHLHAVQKNFDVILEPTWQDLEHNPQKSKDFGGKLILVGKITFKKKESAEPVYLNHLELVWQGAPIETLISSLYKQNLDPNKKDFIPIEDYLVCDGTWNKRKQVLILNFDHKHTLGPINTFYLVLTVPDSLEKIVQNGSFCIEKQCLPYRLKQSIQSDSLALEFTKTRKETTHTAALVH